MRPLLAFSLFLLLVSARAAEPFEIREGDRILLLGDTLLEREGTYGYLETRMHEQFPDRHFIVRNLSWSGETPRGWSRASFDGPDKGTERLKEDIAKVRPTVVFLGFGMAASLQEMTDRAQDITLNPDPKRYGEEPMSAARFKRELGELMDAIQKGSADYADSRRLEDKAGSAPSDNLRPSAQSADKPTSVRFILLSPVRHEDLRAVRPGLPDPTEHNKLLEQYSKAIEELAKERGGRYLDFFHAWEKVPRKNITPADATALAGAAEDLSQNGIHLSELGYSALAEDAGAMLGWTRQIPADRAAFDAWKEKHRAFYRAVLPAVIRKNELFFHQFRPANSTYLFGFRKHEQGQNAKEMPMFDPLIEAAEKEIDRLKAGGGAAAASGQGKGAGNAAPGSSGGSAPAAGGVAPRNGGGVPPNGGAPAAQNSAPAPNGGGVPPNGGSAPRNGGAPISSGGSAPSSGGAPISSGDAPGARTGAPAGNGGTAQPSTYSPPPLPDFTVEDGYQIELWAQNPYLEKPTQMNWDPQGRLWVCSSSLYPQIEPGQAANDKILILEDPERTGRATKSTVFVDGLLIPTGVVPDLVTTKTQRHEGEKEASTSSSSSLRDFVVSPSACYVGQSTELLYFRDTDGDGRADTKRIVFSGFGTEDTHHIVHTLHWGPDGRLYFHQSVYIHTHLETPWGMVRLNSGGVFAYDPRTERVEVFIKGLWNTWGQAEDDWGQSFFTDGAGSTGLSWGFPGATFAPFEGSRRQMASISPGSYPKFCGLEIVKSPHFPAEWQGNAVTCDFRAHRIVRFAIDDLSKDAATRRSGDAEKSAVPASPSPRVPASGYTTTEMPDLVRTSDLSFRPIDVKMGPDGAIYIADWSNPVINHGEVDFRDPRRDHHMGRIWRITKKGAPPVKWEPLLGKKNEELLEKLGSKSAWEQRQVRQLARAVGAAVPPDAASAIAGAPAERLESLVRDANPRVRLEAMRALSRIPTARSADLVLDAALKTPADDPFYDFAAWQSINDLAKPWTDAILSGAWKTEGKEVQLAYGLKAIDPALAGVTLSKLFAAGKVPVDGSGPWLELIGTAGGPGELQRLLDGLLAGYVGDCCETDETRAIDNKLALTGKAAVPAIEALQTAARVRSARPAGHADLVTALFHAPGEIGLGAIRLAGMWQARDAVAKIGELIDSRETKPAARRACVDGLRALGTPALNFLRILTRSDEALDTRAAALVAIAQIKLDAGIVAAAEVIPTISDEAALLGIWRGLLGVNGAPGAFTVKFVQQQLAKNLPPVALTTALRAAREQGRKGTQLVAALTPLVTGGKVAASVTANFAEMAERARVNGDPVRGEFIYRRMALLCTTCHAIGGAGGKVGPDLTSMGASAPLDYVVQSLLDPNAKVKEGYNAVTLTLRDGSQATGILARETAAETILRDATGRETGVPKEMVTAKNDIGSIMPAGLTDALQDRERLDLIAFLGQLGKPGPFDASKGTVARLWRLYPGAAAGEVVSAAFDPAKNPGIPGYTLVDGKFPKELLTEAATMAGATDTVLLAAQFQSSGRTELKLTGIEKAWLDGQPLVLGGEVAPTLANGTHTLVAKIGVKELPPVVRAESAQGRFLGN